MWWKISHGVEGFGFKKISVEVTAVNVAEREVTNKIKNSLEFIKDLGTRLGYQWGDESF